MIYGRSRKERELRAAAASLEQMMSRSFPRDVKLKRKWKVLLVCDDDSEPQVVKYLKEIPQWENQPPRFAEMRALDDTYSNASYMLFFIYVLLPISFACQLLFKLTKKAYLAIKEGKSCRLSAHPRILPERSGSLRRVRVSALYGRIYCLWTAPSPGLRRVFIASTE